MDKRKAKKKAQDEAKQKALKAVDAAQEEKRLHDLSVAVDNVAILTSLENDAKPGFNKQKEKQFWRIFNKAKSIFKDKSFNYKTLAKAITYRLQQGKGTTIQIVRAMERVVKQEYLDRRTLYDAIARA